MTTPASSILARLRRIGGTLSAVDGRLVIEAPEGAVGGELLANIKAHKSAILDHLDERDRWPEGRPWWVDRIMAGREAPPDAGTIGYRAHLARIKRYAASKAEPGETEAGESRLPDATEVTRPGGGPIRDVDTASMTEKIVLESP